MMSQSGSHSDFQAMSAKPDPGTFKLPLPMPWFTRGYSSTSRMEVGIQLMPGQCTQQRTASKDIASCVELLVAHQRLHIASGVELLVAHQRLHGRVALSTAQHHANRSHTRLFHHNHQAQSYLH